MTTATIDKVMVALELAAEHSPREGNWSTIPEIKAYAGEASIAQASVNQSNLETLVAESRAERRYPISNMNRQYRPFRGGAGFGDSNILDIPREPGYPYYPDDGPRDGYTPPDGTPRGGDTYVPPVGVPTPTVSPTVVGGVVRSTVESVM